VKMVRNTGTERAYIHDVKFFDSKYAFAPEQTMPPCAESPRMGRNIVNLLKLGLPTEENLEILSSSRGRPDHKSNPRRRGGSEGLGCDFQPRSCTKPGISTYATENRHDDPWHPESNPHPINEVASLVCFFICY
jgi:hypothetical protein